MTTSNAHPPPLPTLARVPAGTGMAWWREGWRLFSADPGAWIGIIAAWMGISFVLMFLPIIGGALSTLSTPIFAAGVLLGARDIDAGRPLTFAHLFAGFRGPQARPLMMLGVLSLALSLLVFAIVGAILVPLVGADYLMNLYTMDIDLDNLDALARLDLAPLFTVFIVGLPLATCGSLLIGIALWFAPGLVAVQGVPPMKALGLSLRASLSNIVALIVYDLVLLLLAIAATIPLGLGWLLLAPALACSWYASWRYLFGGGGRGLTRCEKAREGFTTGHGGARN
jgi:hypothetical protein